jgi:hypothetical protein
MKIIIITNENHSHHVVHEGGLILIRRLVLAVILFLMLPHSVFAYSYGDPSKEDIAEALLVIKSKLAESPADWEGAYQQYLVHKKVLDLEFGKEVTSTLEANFSVKNQELLEANYRGMLAMNLKRRFDYAVSDIADYSKSKLLLAKAKGTFDVLTPYVKDGNVTAKVNESFERALIALGNPGLFGVGKVEVDEEQFKKEIDWIYTTVKPLFPFKFYVVEDKQEVTPEKPIETKPPAQNDAKTDVKAENEVVPADSTDSKPAAEQDTEAADSEAEKKEPEKKEPDSQEEAAVIESEPAEEQSTVEEPSIVVSETETAEGGETAESDETASPVLDTNLEPESKVNPLVTVSVIGMVLVFSGGAVYFGLKKGLFKF